MFKFRSFALSVLAVMGMGLLSSCDPEEKPDPQVEAPVITFNQNEVNVPQEGGAYAVEFSIANPIEGEKATIAAPQVDWITDVDTSIDGIIQFKVAENIVVEAREATFTVSYKDAADASFVVKQVEGDPTPFKFENEDIQMTDYTVDVIPHDKETRYVVFCTSQAYIDSYNLHDDESLFADDIDYFAYLAEAYGMSLVDYLTEATYVDDCLGYSLNGFSPATDYVIYAYHINIQTQERLTEIVRHNFTTAAPEQIEVNFDFSFEVDGASVYWTVDPGNFDGYYYWDAIDVDAYYASYGEGADLEGYMASYWNEFFAMYAAYGYTFEDLVDLCATGNQVLTVDWLKAETEYAFYAVALDDDSHYVASEPTYELVTTGVVEPSDLVITIDVKEVGSRSAVVDILTSNDDPYFASVFTKDEYNALGSTDEECIAYILENAYMTTTTGDMLDVEITDLLSETDYLIVAFGTEGGVATTAAYKAEFTTTEAVVGNSVMTMTVDGYYNLAEVAELVANFQSYYDYYGETVALATVDTQIEPEAQVFYYGIWKVTQEESDEMTDANWIEILLGYEPKEYLSTAYFVSYDTPLMFVGVAVDENGNFGPVCREPMYIATGDEDPADGFVEWYYGAPARQSMENAQAVPASKVIGKSLTEGRSTEVARQAEVEEVTSINIRPMETLELSRFQQRVK